MDKINFGDYLAKVPRVSNIVYTALILVPIAVPRVRWTLVTERPQRQLFGVIYVNVGVRSLGHRRLRRADLVPDVPPVAGSAHAVGRGGQLDRRGCHPRYRLDHRPGAAVPPPVPADPVHARPAPDGDADRLGPRCAGQAGWSGGPSGIGASPRPARVGLVVPIALTTALGLVFFAPILSNENYRSAYSTGDFDDFFSAYPVGDLDDLKDELLPAAPRADRGAAADRDRQARGGARRGAPQVHRQVLHLLPRPAELLLRPDRRQAEQVRVLPPAEGAVLPAGLVGERRPRHRTRVHRAQQAGREQPGRGRRVPAGHRDLSARGPRGGSRTGRAALRERLLRAVPPGRPAPPDRPVLLFDTSWNGYLDTVFARLDLSRCYDFRYISDYEGTDGRRDRRTRHRRPRGSGARHLVGGQPGSFFTPTSKGFAFNPDVVTSVLLPVADVPAVPAVLRHEVEPHRDDHPGHLRQPERFVHRPAPQHPGADPGERARARPLPGAHAGRGHGQRGRGPLRLAGAGRPAGAPLAPGRTEDVRLRRRVRQRPGGHGRVVRVGRGSWSSASPANWCR